MLTRRLFVLRLRSSRQLSRVVNGEKVVSVTESDVSSSLTDFRMPYKDGPTCFESLCTSCIKNSTGRLFINRRTGFYLCEECQSVGEWSTLCKILGTAKAKGSILTEAELSDLKSGHNVVGFCAEEKMDLEKHIPLYDMPLHTVRGILDVFKLPHVNSAVLQQLDVRISSDHSALFFPFLTVRHTIVGFKVLSSMSGKESFVGVHSVSGLLILRPENLGSRQKCVRTAVLVPTVADLLALASSNIKSHVICLPNGVCTLPLEILPLLESYEKLVLWFGNSDGAWDAVRSFSKKLNGKRCYVVKPTPQAHNAHQAYADGKDLLAMVSGAIPVSIESVVSFKGLRNDVMAELLNIGKVEGVKWQRFPSLNNILKGFRRGELTVLSGSTGCGKTTFMSEYSLDLAQQGVNTLWGSFEIPNYRLARIMLTQMAGVPLQNRMDLFEKFADVLENMPVYFLKFHGQHSSSKVLKVLEHAAYVYDIGHVIIDTVQFMMGVAEDTNTLDRFWRQDNIIAGFRTFATSFNCHVTLIIHPRKERIGEELQLSSVFGGAKATQEADNVFMIQDQRQTNGQLFLKVLKNRYSGELGRMPLEFNKAGLSFTQKKALPNAWKRTETEEQRIQYNVLQ